MKKLIEQTDINGTQDLNSGEKEMVLIKKKPAVKKVDIFKVNKNIKEKFAFPLQLVIIGRTRSGKSHLLRRTIIPSIIKDYNHVFIFSPTAALDLGWKEVKKKYKKKIEFFQEFDNDEVVDLIEGIGDVKIDGGKDRYLFIFDDITDRLTQSPKSYFSKVAVFGRHYNISYIVTSHKYNALNRLMRNNATSKIFFKINSNPESDTITDENATANITQDELLSILHKNTGDHNSFLIQNGADDDDYYRISNKGDLIALK